MASTSCSSSWESWLLAADSPTANGMPVASISRWYLEPRLLRSTGEPAELAPGPSGKAASGPDALADEVAELATRARGDYEAARGIPADPIRLPGAFPPRRSIGRMRLRVARPRPTVARMVPMMRLRRAPYGCFKRSDLPRSVSTYPRAAQAPVAGGAASPIAFAPATCRTPRFPSATETVIRVPKRPCPLALVAPPAAISRRILLGQAFGAAARWCAAWNPPPVGIRGVWRPMWLFARSSGFVPARATCVTWYAMPTAGSSRHSGRRSASRPSATRAGACTSSSTRRSGPAFATSTSTGRAHVRWGCRRHRP
jgi:hypothetical protein